MNKKFYSTKRAQQEMVGFVLIVALVIVGLLIFLTISLRAPTTQNYDHQETNHMLRALLKQTSTCATEFVPNYDTTRDLLKACYRGQTCKNTAVSACEYLNQTLPGNINMLLETTNHNSYHLEVFEEDDTGRKGFLQFTSGTCSTRVAATQENIAQDSNTLIVRLSLCNS